MARTYLRGRVHATRRTALLAAGDLLALVVFAAAGAVSHGGGPVEVIETAGEFGVGWLVVALAVGAYGPRAVDGWRRAALLGAGAWAVGAPIGGLVRVAAEPGAGLSPVFVLVTAGVGAVVFGGWRAAAAALVDR